MARVTVEDCVERVPNRFELVLAASQRSRDIATGAQIELDRDNDKNPVVALREIAEDRIAPVELIDSLVRNLQKHVDVDEPEEEDMMEKMATGSLEDKPVEEPPTQKTSPFGTDLPDMPAFDDIDPSLMED